MNYIKIAAGIAVCGIALYFAWPKADDSAVKKTPTLATSNAVPASVEKVADWPPPSPYQGMEPKRVPLLPTGPEMPAAQSLAETRNGDPRTPPIIRSEVKTEQPSAAELADPKEYAKYETRQNMKLYASFVQAAKDEVPRLRADIEKGRAMGISPEKIAKVEEKARRIEAMQAQLIKDHPELAKLSSAPSN